jgi:hypothetical protein
MGISLVMLFAVAAASNAVIWSERQDGGVLSLAPARLETGTVAASGREFATLTLPEAGLAAEVGSPAVPVYRRLVEVPYDCSVEVSADVGKTETRQLALPLVPRQAPAPKTGPAAAFALDAKVYSTDAYAPEIGASLLEIANVRGRRVAVIEIHPVTYNPVRNLVEYAPKLKVTVSWTGADWGKTRAMLRRYSSPPFAGRLHGIAINERQLARAAPVGQFRAGLGPDLPIGYLIIVPDEWQANVAPLAEWRRRKGSRVFVRNLTEVAVAVQAR